MIKVPDTLQEIFDIVSTHLLKQGKRSMAITRNLKINICAYRGRDGTKCAAGVLIPDNQYKPEFEGKSWFALVDDKKVESKFMYAIKELQSIHDFAENWTGNLNYMKLRLRRFAERHNLIHNIEV